MLNLAIQAAIIAGKAIMEIYSDPASDFYIEKKADNSPLTQADKASHTIIADMLEHTGLPILSEEGSEIKYDDRKNWNLFWLVDPLDGTKEFIKRNGEFTVNIALIEKGKPLAGIIYLPAEKTLYTGLNSGNRITGSRSFQLRNLTGAWKIKVSGSSPTFDDTVENGQKLPCNPSPQIYTIAGSRSHMSAETKGYMNKRKAEHSNINIISKGSSLKICLVAEGTAHEYPRLGPTMEWDTAAGHAIINAVGKHLWLTDFSGELNYNKENLLNPYFIVK